jgi:hypothetical protein
LGQLSRGAARKDFVMVPLHGERAMKIASHVFAMCVMLTTLGGDAAADPLDFKRLALINGWERYTEFATRPPGVAIDSNDVVHLRGAIAQPTGTVDVPFVLPRKYRPQANVYVPVDLANGKPGMLTIRPSGNVSVVSAANTSDAQIFTSLEGVKYSRR